MERSDPRGIATGSASPVSRIRKSRLPSRQAKSVLPWMACCRSGMKKGTGWPSPMTPTASPIPVLNSLSRKTGAYAVKLCDRARTRGGEEFVYRLHCFAPEESLVGAVCHRVALRGGESGPWRRSQAEREGHPPGIRRSDRIGLGRTPGRNHRRRDKREEKSGEGNGHSQSIGRRQIRPV